MKSWPLIGRLLKRTPPLNTQWKQEDNRQSGLLCQHVHTRRAGSVSLQGAGLITAPCSTTIIMAPLKPTHAMRFSPKALTANADLITAVAAEAAQDSARRVNAAEGYFCFHDDVQT